MLLEIRNLKKSYKLTTNNSFVALKGINVSFNKGELVSIIGESGSGKSTLMNLIGGLDLDFEGEIRINGTNIKSLKEKELDKYRKNKIGFIFQSFNLIPHLTVIDNVTIAPILSNVGKSERIKRAEKILEKLGLKDQMHKKPNQLSGGQMQRVAIARALINEPEIILADEPTGSLDSKTSEQILDIIKDIANNGKLVIMVTHSERVANISHRIITLSDGLIISDKANEQAKGIDKNIEIMPKRNQNLSFISSLGLAYKNMREKISRNILVSIGASIGIMSVVLMLSLGNGVEKYLSNTMESYVNPLVVEVNKKSTDTNATDLPASRANSMITAAVPFDESEIESIKNIDNVIKVEEGYNSISFNSNKIIYGDNTSSIILLGTVSENITSENITKGNLPKKNQILIDKSTLDTLKLGDDSIGKEVKIEIDINNKKISGNFKISGIYGDTSTGQMNNFTAVYLNYEDLKNLAEENDIEVKPTTLYLITNDSKYTNDIKTKITDMGYLGSKQEQILNMFSEIINIVTYVLAAVSGIALIVSAIMILVVLYISVVERTKEIGVLKAIGARRKDISRIFTAEAFIIGLASGVIGICAAYILGSLVNYIVNRLYNVTVVSISLTYVLFGIGISIIISVIAGLSPAAKAAKLDPVIALRRE
jgi:ABC-type lipoprotein export system ATPase subunit/ABC-type antimicrobial peptide transport system permease subunit